MPKTRETSPRRLAANRANSARSTGPRTPQGKAISAQNSGKHGFAAASFAVIRLEELDAVAHLKQDLVATWQPVNSQELFAVERIALAQQALLRAAALEAGMFASCLNTALTRDGALAFSLADDLTCGIEVAQAQNRAYALAEGLQLQAGRSNGFALFLRYQAQTERLYRRSVEEFARLRALRAELPNEPIIETQPQEAKPLPTPETDPQPSPPLSGADPPDQGPASSVADRTEAAQTGDTPASQGGLARRPVSLGSASPKTASTTALTVRPTGNKDPQEGEKHAELGLGPRGASAPLYTSLKLGRLVSR